MTKNELNRLKNCHLKKYYINLCVQLDLLNIFKRLTKSASKQTQADLAKRAEIQERKSQKILEDNEEWELKSCGGFTRIYPSLEKLGFQKT